MVSNNEEKILILKMLEEGKINSEEAYKLLSTLDTSELPSENTFKVNLSKENAKAAFSDEVLKLREKVSSWKKDFKTSYAQKDFDKVIDEFSTKAEKLGRTLAATTFGFADKVVDFIGSFVDTTSFNIFGGFKAVEKTFEADTFEGMELAVKGLNGSIVIKKHPENKIVINSKIRSIQTADPDDILELIKNEHTVFLDIKKSGNISVSHEVLVPSTRFKSIILETSNGKIYAEDTVSQEFSAVTKNSHIDLMGVNSNNTSLKTKNARILVSYAIVKNIDINTSNSIVDVKHVKVESLNAATSNGKIMLEDLHTHEDSETMNLSLKTSNSSIKVNMNDMENKGYKINAFTTHGSINLLIPEIVYNNIRKTTDKNFIEAQSSNYNDFKEKVIINADTTNGYVEVIK